MKIDVLMPQMGESIAEGTIAKWLKKVGDVVDRDEPLLEISTDKVDAEIPSPAAGILVAIHVVQGAMAEVNSVVAVIESDASAAGAAISAAAAPAAASTPTPAPAASAHAASVSTPSLAAAAAVPDGVRVSAVARRAAGVHGVDLSTVTPTGEAGRIVKQDVLSAVAAGAPAGAVAGKAGAAARGAAPRTAVAPVAGRVTGETEVVPLSTMRRKIAEHMTASKATSAHAYTLFQVDCSRVEAARQAQKREFEAAGAKLTVLPFILQAAARVLREFPVLHASLTDDGIVYHPDINIGVAVALDSGLIVPVVRNADRLSLLEISLAIGDLAKRARAKQLKPEEVAGGTFTVTNPGNFGGVWATPIINQPQVGILEIGTVEKRVVVVNDALAIRAMVNLTLGFDHRLIDGAVADHYVAAVKKALESWGDRS